MKLQVGVRAVVMALCGLPNGVVVTSALLALLVLPAQYYVPELEEPAAAGLAGGAGGGGVLAALELALHTCPPLDLLATALLLLLAAAVYLSEWIQRKLMEKRLVKLNQYLSASVERLAEWDAQQEQLECTLKLVQNATSEYNLLLYLLLRQHRCLRSACPPTCYYEKSYDEGHPFLSPNVDQY